MNHIPHTARASIKLAPETWNKWLAICDALQQDDVEVTVEEFAPFSEKFNTLQRLGVPFDDAFVLRVRELQRSLINADNDADADNHDAMLTERELDCDEHGSYLSDWHEGESGVDHLGIELYKLTDDDRPPFRGRKGAVVPWGKACGRHLAKCVGSVIDSALRIARREKFPLCRARDLVPSVESWQRRIDEHQHRLRDDGLL